MTRTPFALKERVGVTAVRQIIQSEFGWLFRDQLESDHGVDAQIEELDFEGKPTGKLIALQIKSGASYFRKKGDGYVYYTDHAHFSYWLNHSLPCYIILYNPETGLTLWQKIEKRFAAENDKAWAILIPASNVLNGAAKEYFAKELASDPESIRRFNMAFDLELMKQIADREVYFEVNEWVNKSLKFRNVGVSFDEMGKDTPDFIIHLWAPARSLFEFMDWFFPWLDYEYLEVTDSMGEEVAVHTIAVQVNELGKQFLAVEEYFAKGPRERPEPMLPALKEADEYDPG